MKKIAGVYLLYAEHGVAQTNFVRIVEVAIRSLTRGLLSALMVSLIAACSGEMYAKKRMANFRADQTDFDQLAIGAFKIVDPTGSIHTIAVPPGFDPRASLALRHVAKVVPSTSVPRSKDVLLPAGYFEMKEFSVEDGVAMIEGQLGPVTNALTAANIPDCGKIYTVVYELEGADWVSHSHRIETCTESRHWVPIDETQGNQ